MKITVIATLIVAMLSGAFLSNAAHADSSLQQKSVIVTEGTALSAAVSPNGKWIALDLQGSLWIIPAEGGKAVRITGLIEDARQPIWSPDSQHIAYFAYSDGGYDLWSISPDGQNRQQLTTGSFDDREPSWSPDGKFIAFSSDRKNSAPSYDIWLLQIADGKISMLTNDPYENRMPIWSSDGNHLSYSTKHSGEYQINTINIAAKTTVTEVTAASNLTPVAWSNSNLYYVEADKLNNASLKVAQTNITGDEYVFPFKGSLDAANNLYYVADGKIKKRNISNLASVSSVEFSAELFSGVLDYKHISRDFVSNTERPLLGIMRPTLSPDGNSVAFVALGDLYLMKIGEKPVNLSNDHYVEADPAWSPDGRYIVYSSDKGDKQLQLWIYDLTTGQSRQLTHMETQPMGADWSPDGKKIAFLNMDGVWGVASIALVDFASGEITQVTSTLKQLAKPDWSPLGDALMVSREKPFSASFREGTNQIYMIPLDDAEPYWIAPIENVSFDTRGGGGPVWSPDGKKMAAIYSGEVQVWSVDKNGMPIGPVRSLSSEMAHNPTWSGDSRSILFQSNENLKKVDVLSGEISNIDVDLSYYIATPKDSKVLHTAGVVDGIHDSLQKDMDIIIEGNLIKGVVPHTAALHKQYQVVDASGLYAMPGLIDSHVHGKKNYGQNLFRAWLSFGITTIRDPGNQPYHGVEDREASEAGVRISPRIYTTGHLFEWQRTYYRHGAALQSPAHLEKELQRAKALKYDLLKSYVRLPDAQQKRMVDFAHNEMGVQVSSHELYPASLLGVDRVEHLGATSRRGYSTKQMGGRAYQDVIALMDKIVSPTMFGSLNLLLAEKPEYRDDPRLSLYPIWAQEGFKRTGNIPIGMKNSMEHYAKTINTLYKQGTTIVAGTDLVMGMNLHAELRFYVNNAGLTPFQALQTATKNAAEAMALNAGTIEKGKLADIALVAANPLADISNALRVKRVVINGFPYTMDQLLNTAYRPLH